MDPVMAMTIVTVAALVVFLLGMVAVLWFSRPLPGQDGANEGLRVWRENVQKLQHAVGELAAAQIWEALGLPAGRPGRPQVGSHFGDPKAIAETAELIKKMPGAVDRIKTQAVNDEAAKFQDQLAKLEAAKQVQPSPPSSEVESQEREPERAAQEPGSQGLAEVQDQQREPEPAAQEPVSQAELELAGLREAVNSKLRPALERVRGQPESPMSGVLASFSPLESNERILEALSALLTRLEEDGQVPEPGSDVLQALANVSERIRRGVPDQVDRLGPNGIISFCEAQLKRKVQTATEARNRDAIVLDLLHGLLKWYRLT